MLGVFQAAERVERPTVDAADVVVDTGGVQDAGGVEAESGEVL